MDNNNGKEGKIIAICPTCKKRFRDQEGEKYIRLQFLVPTNPKEPQKMTLPLYLCTTCGIYFHPFTVLDELKKILQGEGSRIIKAPANVELVK